MIIYMYAFGMGNPGSYTSLKEGLTEAYPSLQVCLLQAGGRESLGLLSSWQPAGHWHRSLFSFEPLENAFDMILLPTTPAEPRFFMVIQRFAQVSPFGILFRAFRSAI